MAKQPAGGVPPAASTGETHALITSRMGEVKVQRSSGRQYTPWHRMRPAVVCAYWQCGVALLFLCPSCQTDVALA
jgi:hypothetical protein